MSTTRTLRFGFLAVAVLVLVFSLFLVNCGGGGGGETSSGSNTSTTTYTGSSSQATITQGNATTLTNSGANSVRLSSTAGGSSVGAPRFLRGPVFGLTAAAHAPETLSGNCGGTSVSDSTVDNATGAISGTTTYNAYCQNGTTENGRTSFSGTFNAATGALDVTMTFTDYAVKDPTSDDIMNGTATLTGTMVSGTLNSYTMIMNILTKDNIGNVVLKMENVNIAVIDTAGYSQFTINSGKVYHPDYGYFDLSTPTAIRTNAGDANPSSGVLVVTGANNTKGKLSYLSNTQSTVEVDETGSGTYILVATTGTPTTASAPKNELVSRSTDSTVTGTNAASEWPALSADGRFVAFVSSTANLAPGASGLKRQIFVHDRQTHQTEMVSVGPAGAEGNGDSFAPAVSSDGRYVVFESYASNLIAGDGNALRDVFIRDRQALTTVRVSVGAGGIEANSESYQPSVSADGRFVAFSSSASNLAPGVSSTSTVNVYVRDLAGGTTTLVSADAGGTGVGGSLPAISADGSRIAFYSFASTLVAGDTNGLWDIFLYDSAANPKISLMSVSSAGVQKNQGSESISRVVAPAISADGDIVAFSTTADNLVTGDTNSLQDVFIHQVSTGVTIRASEGTGGVQATGGDSPAGQGERVALSSDGTWVAFTTSATNISAGGSNVLIHNNLTDETIAITAISTNASGSKGPAISGDGRFVAFMSSAQFDPRFSSSGVFVQDRTIP